MRFDARDCVCVTPTSVSIYTIRFRLRQALYQTVSAQLGIRGVESAIGVFANTTSHLCPSAIASSPSTMQGLGFVQSSAKPAGNSTDTAAASPVFSRRSFMHVGRKPVSHVASYPATAASLAEEPKAWISHRSSNQTEQLSRAT